MEVESLFENESSVARRSTSEIAAVPSQAVKNKIAANKTRALKKRLLKRKELEDAKPKWEIRKEANLFENPKAEEEKGERGPRDGKDDAAVREQLRLLEARLKAKQDAGPKIDEPKKNEHVENRACEVVSSSGAASSWEVQQKEGQSSDADDSDTAEQEEKEAAEKRKAWCEEHNRQCLRLQGLAPVEAKAAPVVDATVQHTPDAPSEVLWDLVVVEDLLELEESGAGVTWPRGLDTIEARKLLERRQKS